MEIDWDGCSAARKGSTEQWVGEAVPTRNTCKGHSPRKRTLRFNWRIVECAPSPTTNHHTNRAPAKQWITLLNPVRSRRSLRRHTQGSPMSRAKTNLNPVDSIARAKININPHIAVLFISVLIIHTYHIHLSLQNYKGWQRQEQT